MPLIIEPPTGLAYQSIDATSVRIEWLPSKDADGYEMRGGGGAIIRSISSSVNFAIVNGLRPSRQADIQLRATFNDLRSDWASVSVRPSTPIEAAPRIGVGVVPVIDADRQSVQMRLPDANGDIQDIRLSLWWSPSDNGWWSGLEVPTNVWAVRSRSLALNVGILDDVPGVLAGNIVMRSTQSESTEEPTRTAFVDKTHRLIWEPNNG